MRTRLILSALLCAFTSPTQARNIVVSNDDGLTSNVVALYDALKKAGHDVIVSIPCRNQSGMGTAMLLFDQPARTTADCRNRAVRAGMAVAGPITRPGIDPKDFFYVEGTPTMALMYGLDVVAARRWGAPPDLVLSGPNEGQNVGPMIIGSGTVSNAQFAALRDIPAVAVSAGTETVDDAGLRNPASLEVARRVIELVTMLDRHAIGGGAMLPSGVALNVNFPDKLAGAKWRLSNVGTFSPFRMRYVENLAKEMPEAEKDFALKHGLKIGVQPGVAVSINHRAPDTDSSSDEAIVYRTAIALSPMQAGVAAPPVSIAWAKRQFEELFSAH